MTICVSNIKLENIADQAVADGKAANISQLLSAALAIHLIELGYDVPDTRASKGLSPEQIEKDLKEYIPGVNGTEIAARHGKSLSAWMQAVRRHKIKQANKPAVKKGRSKK